MDYDAYEDVSDRFLSVNRPDRLDFLQELEDGERLQQRDYWRLVADVWTDTESAASNYAKWTDIWRSAQGEGAGVWLMTDEEQAELAALPAELTIHRGYTGEEWRGAAWTLDRERAEWFARRFAVLDGPGSVATATVSKDAVIALFNARQEREVIVLPDALRPTMAPAA